jgi:hypothetical protein
MLPRGDGPIHNASVEALTALRFTSRARADSWAQTADNTRGHQDRPNPSVSESVQWLLHCHQDLQRSPTVIYRKYPRVPTPNCTLLPCDAQLELGVHVTSRPCGRVH